MKRFKIGGVPEHFNLPWRLSIEEGRLNHLDVEMHWSDMTGGTGQMIKGLSAGSIDIAVLLTEGITKAILDGLDAKIIRIYVKSPLRWGIHTGVNSNINSPEDIKDKNFAISREGSGSHLMAYVNAYQKGWSTNDLSFNIIGDIYGGLWALESGESDAFLWEKWTTQPFVDGGKCRCVGEVVTTWPCFVVAVRGDVWREYSDILEKVLDVVGLTAKEIKEENKWSEISWRYALKDEYSKTWLSETEWNYGDKINTNDFQLVIDYLSKLNLISDKENWEDKLF